MKFKKKFLNVPRLRTFSFFLIAALIFTWLGFSMRRELLRKQEMGAEVSTLKASIEKLQKENEELSKKIVYIKDEKNIEREARERLNLKKPDERVAIIVPPKNKNQEGAGEADQQSANTSFFRKILNAFMELGKNLTE